LSYVLTFLGGATVGILVFIVAINTVGTWKP